MSGAFHKFFGLSNTNPINLKTGREKNVIGEPCLYEEHYSDVNGFRSSKTGACVKCIELLDNGKGINLDVTQFNANIQRRVLNFWSKVDIT